jgi:hypothetical protein
MVSSTKDARHTAAGRPRPNNNIERECRGDFENQSQPDKGTTVICKVSTTE